MSINGFVRYFLKISEIPLFLLKKFQVNIVAKFFLTSALAYSLSGCAPTLVKTHPNTPVEKIARLKNATIKLDNAAYTTYFSMYAPRHPSGSFGEFVQVGNSWTGFPTQLEMPVGSYLLSIQCSTNAQFGYLRMPVTLEARASYEVSCEPAEGRLNTVIGRLKKLD